MNHTFKSKSSIAFKIIFYLLLFALLITFISFSIIGRRKINDLTRASENLYHLVERNERTVGSIVTSLSAINYKEEGGGGVEEKVDEIIIEELSSPIQRANAYKKIAFRNQQQKNANGLWKAVINASSALDAAYSHENVLFLAEILNLPKDENFLSKLGWQDEELPFLMAALQSASDDNSKMMLSLRIFWILQQGRASAEDQRVAPKMHEALKFRKLAIKHGKGRLLIANNPPIDTVFIINEGYAVHAAVAISSILMNSLPETVYKFHFITDPAQPISQESKKKLSALTTIANAEINFRDFPEEVIKNQTDSVRKKIDVLGKNKIIFSKPVWPRLISYRLFIDKLFPNLDRVLYLDADIVVNIDLQKLFNKNIDNYYLAAGVDFPNFAKWAQRLSKCSGEKIPFYFNSGVLLYNLKEMRGDNFDLKVQQLLSNTTCKLRHFDQDVLNIVAKDKTLRLASVWNYSDALNYQFDFHSFGEVKPSINHMYRDMLLAKANIAKPWKQKDAHKLWQEGKFDQIHPTFWAYWAYRDLAEQL